MNQNQRQLIGFATVAFLILAAFPPVIDSSDSVCYKFWPRAVESYESFRIAIGQFLIGWGIVFVATTGWFLSLGGQEKKQDQASAAPPTV